MILHVHEPRCRLAAGSKHPVEVALLPTSALPCQQQQQQLSHFTVWRTTVMTTWRRFSSVFVFSTARSELRKVLFLAPSVCGFFVMAALWNSAGHYIFMLWFLSIFFYFFSSPNLSGRRLGVYHTSIHQIKSNLFVTQNYTIPIKRR